MCHFAIAEIEIICVLIGKRVKCEPNNLHAILVQLAPTSTNATKSKMNAFSGGATLSKWLLLLVLKGVANYFRLD